MTKHPHTKSILDDLTERGLLRQLLKKVEYTSNRFMLYVHTGNRWKAGDRTMTNMNEMYYIPMTEVTQMKRYEDAEREFKEGHRFETNRLCLETLKVGMRRCGKTFGQAHD